MTPNGLNSSNAISLNSRDRDMKQIKLLTFLLLSGAAGISRAQAGPMPAGAVPLTQDEVKAVYADHTAMWKTSSAYFAADGTTKGWAGGNWVFWGKQTINGNELCMINQGIDSKTKKSDGKTSTDCWKWVKAKDGKLWTLYAKAWDDQKLDLVNGWGTDEVKHLKAGDLVEAKYKARGGP